ncbi:MAG: hypothetical protein H0X45_07330 [Planctomycetes bacterium]|nr:hypothetical protein [Planctomycetota bacterium]
MNDPITTYLRRVSRHLALGGKARFEVLREMRGHLHELERQRGGFADADEIARVFGSPRRLGRALSRARAAAPRTARHPSPWRRSDAWTLSAIGAALLGLALIGFELAVPGRIGLGADRDRLIAWRVFEELWSGLLGGDGPALGLFALAMIAIGFLAFAAGVAIWGRRDDPPRARRPTR